MRLAPGSLSVGLSGVFLGVLAGLLAAGLPLSVLFEGLVSFARIAGACFIWVICPPFHDRLSCPLSRLASLAHSEVQYLPFADLGVNSVPHRLHILGL